MIVRTSVIAVAAAIAVGIAAAYHASIAPASAPPLTSEMQQTFDPAFAFDESVVDFAALRSEADAALRALIEKRDASQAS